MRSIFVLLPLLMIWACGRDPVSPKDTTPPVPPKGMAILKFDNGEVIISWDENEEKDLEGYKVYRADGSGDFKEISFVTSPPFQDVNLTYTTIYSYRVTAVDAHDNESLPSNTVSGQPLNTLPPEVPQNLRASAHNISLLGQLDVTLRWVKNTESDVAAYRIYRSTGEGFDIRSSAFIRTTGSTMYVDKEVEIGVTYYYRVTAFDRGMKESSPSAVVSATPLTAPVLISPRDRAVASATPLFSWEPVEGASSYVLFLSTSPATGEIWTVEVQAPSRSTKYTGKPLKSGETYYWKLATVVENSDEINSLSGIKSFTVE